MQWQMACSGRRWCDYVSFDPRLPEPARVMIVRVARDDARIAELEGEVLAFLDELARREAELRARAGGPRPVGRTIPEAAAADSAGPAAGPPPAPAEGSAVSETAASDPARRAPDAADPAPQPPSSDRPREPMAAASASRRAIVDVATTRRQPLTPRQRLALYEAHGGVCCICGNRIIGGRWVDEHIRPLSLGGSNDLDNRAPAHERCAQEKTRDDLRRLAKAKRQKRAHLGLKAATRLIASRPFPASDRVRPNLSPLGPPRAARLMAERSADPDTAPGGAEDGGAGEAPPAADG